MRGISRGECVYGAMTLCHLHIRRTCVNYATHFAIQILEQYFGAAEHDIPVVSMSALPHAGFNFSKMQSRTGNNNSITRFI